MTLVEFMNDFQFKERSLAIIVLGQWLPIIFSVVIGGLLANILFPRWQQTFQESRKLIEKKFEISEEIARQFIFYHNAWRRLLYISKLEQENTLSELQMERKQSYVKLRDTSKDSLHSSLAVSKLYFSPDTCTTLDDFCRWDNAQSTKDLDDLALTDWELWEIRVIEAIGSGTHLQRKNR